MQTGEFITDRLLPGMIQSAAASQGINCQKFSDDWVIRLEQGGRNRWVVGYKFDINTAAAAQIAQDKVAAYQVMTAAGVAAVPHILVRSLSGEPVHAIDVESSHGVVMKPLAGTGGHGVHLKANIDDALGVIKSSYEPAWALSPYREIGTEYRVVMLDGKAVLIYEKTKPAVRDGLKLFNLGLGARARHVPVGEADYKLIDLAKAAAAALSLRLVAIDVVRIGNGWQVLEANDGLMMENYARQSHVNNGRALQIYSQVLSAMFN